MRAVAFGSGILALLANQMARPPKGKPLTYRGLRLDDDVWAECQRLGKEHGTINEGLSAALAALRMQEAQGRVMAETTVAMPVYPITAEVTNAHVEGDDLHLTVRESKPKRHVQTWKRGPRQKGDKTR